MGNSRQQFEALVAPHVEALYRAAFRLTRQSHDAEDLVQDVCLRAYSALDNLGTLDSVRGWLLRVQYRLFVDADRRRRRSPVNGHCMPGESEDSWASDSPGPEDLAEATLQWRRMSAAWDCLSMEQRALLGLHAEGYSLAELEQITGRNRATLSARLHRARRRLAKLLEIDASASQHLKPTVSSNEL